MPDLLGKSEITTDRDAGSRVASGNAAQSSGFDVVQDDQLEGFKAILNDLPLIQQCDPEEAMLSKLAEEVAKVAKKDNMASTVKKKQKEVEFITNALSEAHKFLKRVVEGDMDLKDGKADDKGKGKKKAAKKEVVKDATWEEDKKKAEEAVKLKESQLNLYQKSLQVAKDILTAFERECEITFEITTKFLGTHYRTQVLKLHPDRNGEHLREKFESFKVGMDVLRNSVKRQLYISQMMKVQMSMPQATQRGHEVWMKKHAKSVVQEDSAPVAASERSKNKKEKTAAQTMAIEMGNLSVTPKIPIILYFSDTHKAKILFYLPFGFGNHFPCKINYEIKNHDTDELLSTLHLNDVNKLQFEKDIDFKEFGSFELRFSVETSSHFGQYSQWREVLHLDPKELKEDARREKLEKVTKIRNDYLSTVIKKAERFLDQSMMSTNKKTSMVSQKEDNTQQTRSLYDELHRATVRARNCAEELKEAIGDVYDEYYKELSTLIDEGQKLTSIFDAKVMKKASKDASRFFVRFIADMLETHRFDDWLTDKSITGADIESFSPGAGMNRLYQILVEGKKSSLELSSFVCEAAATRSDWFNEKQRKHLTTRAEELRIDEEKIEREEVEQIKKEQERLQRDDDFQRKLVEQKHSILQEAPEKFDFKGKRVILQRLNGADAVLNGRGGTVQPYDLANDQFAVRLNALPPGTAVTDNRSAITVFDYQLRVMTKKEEAKALKDEQLWEKANDEKQRLAKLKAEQEAERKDEELALKLVEQQMRREQGLSPKLEEPPLPPKAAKKAPTDASRLKMHKGVVKSFNKGIGYIGYDGPKCPSPRGGSGPGKTKKTQIFFHFKEIIIPKIVEEDETLLTMFSRNGWKMAFCKVGSPVLFDIGEFKDHGKVANNIFLVDVEKALLQKKMKRDQEAAKLSAPVSTKVVPASGGGTSWANLAATQAAAPVKTAKLTQEERDWKRYSKYKDIDGKISNLSNPNNADYNPTLATELKEIKKRVKARMKAGKAPPALHSSSGSISSAGSGNNGSLPTGEVEEWGTAPQAPSSPSGSLGRPGMSGPPPGMSGPPGLGSSFIGGSDIGSHPLSPGGYGGGCASPQTSPHKVSPAGGLGFGFGFGSGFASGFGGGLGGEGISPTASLGSDFGGLGLGLAPPPGASFSSSFPPPAAAAPLIPDSNFNPTAPSWTGMNMYDKPIQSVASIGASGLSKALMRGNVQGSKLKKFAMAYMGKLLIRDLKEILRGGTTVGGGALTVFPALKIGYQPKSIIRGGFRTSDGLIPVAVKQVHKSNQISEVAILRQLSLASIPGAEKIVMAEVLAEDSAFNYIGYSLCDGSLADLIMGTPNFPPVDNQIVLHGIVSQILEALTFLHRKDISHRSLSPTNILFRFVGGRGNKVSMLLSEAGIDRKLDENEESQGFLSREMALLKLGEHENPNWQPNNDELKRADVFAFGLICYYVMSGGVHPFANPRRPKRISDRETRIADGEAPSLAEVYDPEAQHLFQQCLSHDPGRRPATTRLCGLNKNFKHPFFFSPADRVKAVQVCEAWCSSNEEFTGMNLFENFVSNSWKWKSSFVEVFHADGSVNMGPIKGRSMYGDKGRDLIKFITDVIEQFDALVVDSKVKTSIKTTIASMGQVGRPAPLISIVMWLKMKAPLLWILLFEDSITDKLG